MSSNKMVISLLLEKVEMDSVSVFSFGNVELTGLCFTAASR